MRNAKIESAPFALYPWITRAGSLGAAHRYPEVSGAPPADPFTVAAAFSGAAVRNRPPLPFAATCSPL
ncbi:hypothetical protein [Streptomyces sp. BK022]|uniref:hypothetical protein n=1 Tax=Streptomyces sp. BK022 TaxID=2512123 RepID=UPI0010299404|nr:hypothetical protein [Streptomyces sp. BK022]